MKTHGLQSYQRLQQGSLLDKATQNPSSSAELSGDEEKMIKKKFSGNNKPLELYEGSGSVRQEQPSAKGSNIDLTG